MIHLRVYFTGGLKRGHSTSSSKGCHDAECPFLCQGPLRVIIQDVNREVAGHVDFIVIAKSPVDENGFGWAERGRAAGRVVTSERNGVPSSAASLDRDADDVSVGARRGEVYRA